ncbi:MAG TPA: hypothetical protein VJO12_07150 [Stellaceae bacterium]|nr:hypothetical protein [Stellaceae bacterium]
MSEDEISKLAAELFRLHLAEDHAAHDRLFHSLTENQWRAVRDKILDIGEKMCRLEDALESDDTTAAAVAEEVAAEIALFAGGGEAKPH